MKCIPVKCLKMCVAQWVDDVTTRVESALAPTMGASGAFADSDDR